MSDLLVFTVELSIGHTVSGEAGETIEVESLTDTELDVKGFGDVSIESLATPGLDVRSFGDVTVESLGGVSLDARGVK